MTNSENPPYIITSGESFYIWMYPLLFLDTVWEQKLLLSSHANFVGRKISSRSIFLLQVVYHLISRNHGLFTIYREQEFINELRRYSTMSETVLQNKELKKMFLPILRADFFLDETYSYYKDDPLNCPISVLGGTEDKEANQEELACWRQHTLGSFNFQSFPEDHFFIKSSQSLVLNSISQVLSRFT